MELSNEYIAGFFDGEGCITSSLQWTSGKYIKKPRVAVHVTISNTRKDVLEAIGNKYDGTVSSKGQGKHKNCFHLRIVGKAKMKKFLTSIYPYLVIKKDDVVLALEFIESLRDKNLGPEPLPIEVHNMRQRVNEALKKRKLPEMRFIN